MHELSVVEGIVRVAVAAAQQAGARAIVAIDLEIGDMTGVVDESVRFYFDLLSQDTPAAGARLRIRRDPCVGKCAACGYCGPVSAPISAFCPACSSDQWQISGGRNLLVTSIEIAPFDSVDGGRVQEGGGA